MPRAKKKIRAKKVSTPEWQGRWLHNPTWWETERHWFLWVREPDWVNLERVCGHVRVVGGDGKAFLYDDRVRWTDESEALEFQDVGSAMLAGMALVFSEEESGA